MSTVSDESNFLQVEIDEEMMKTIQHIVKTLDGDMRKILKSAVNTTATKTKTQLAEKAQEVYTVKKSSAKKAETIKKATLGNPTATITVKGETLELKEFKITAPKSGGKAKVLKSSALKLIQSQRGGRAKAFMVTFASGHTTLAQRQHGETYSSSGMAKRASKWGRNADMTKVKKLLSISMPKMLGGSKVLTVVEPDIYELLMDNIMTEIAKVATK